VRVVRLGVEDAEELLAAIERSRELHRPWVSPPDTLEALQLYLGAPAETRIPYGIRAADGGLAGVINIQHVIMGAFQSAFLGFYAFMPYERQGFMSRGMGSVLELAFTEHALHRLEANVQPDNIASTKLVRSLGFRLEGHSPRYLMVDGAWRDHDRHAITVEDWLKSRLA